jgi:hypothetical protein
MKAGCATQMNADLFLWQRQKLRRPTTAAIFQGRQNMTDQR